MTRRSPGAFRLLTVSFVLFAVSGPLNLWHIIPTLVGAALLILALLLAVWALTIDRRRANQGRRFVAERLSDRERRESGVWVR